MQNNPVPKILSSLEGILSLPSIEFDLRQFILPTKAGIYFVLYEFNGRPAIAYVGKSKDLNKRWIRHHRIPEINVLRKLSIPVEIAWYVIEDSTDEVLKEWETALIELFSPPFNYTITVESEQRRIRRQTRESVNSVSDIVQDYYLRLSIGLSAVQSDEVWELCNDEDGDLNCLWVYPDGIKLVDVNYLFMHYEASHSVCPSRVPYPPAFRANNTGFVVPNKDYEPSMEERQTWVLELAELTDSWLLAVAGFYASRLSKQDRAVVLARIADSPSLRELVLQSEPK